MLRAISRLREEFSGRASPPPVDGLLGAARVLLFIVLAGVILAIAFDAIGLVVRIARLGDALLVSPLEPVWDPVNRLAFELAALFLVAGIVGSLLAMIGAVGRGEAFALDNVGRMETIAYDVLGLQVLGLVAARAGFPIGAGIVGIDLGVGLTPAGLAFVLVLFVLARVFREGTRLREELEGTV